MIETKFRGKDIDSGKWHYGDLVKKFNEMKNDKVFILDIGENGNAETQVFYNPVNPETVGQYTGLLDKNVEGIYSGDICESDSEYDNFLVDFRDGSFVIVHRPTCRAEEEGECKTDILDNNCIDIYGLKIIGNKFDNPELIK